ncbi:hypothetical protein DFS33DRAFT_1124874 [Desarmillaria ectypa]|nr:hypothetical protein DFS33DRAFT_1124874 [Desarmillaria ectypa]
MRSSTSAIRRLVIEALAGLPLDHVVRAKEVFNPHWDEIRDEKERMLMDCMELARDGSTRWIPNIDRRIEPLLRLEILFHPLRWNFPFVLFREHNLDFSTTDISDTLLITLSPMEDPHIQKPKNLPSQNQVAINALACTDLQHPFVWKNLLDHDTVKEGLFHDMRDFPTIQMCLGLAKNIYFPEMSPSTSYSCTFAAASAIFLREDVVQSLLSFLQEPDSHNNSVDLEARLLIAIIRHLVLDAAQLTLANDSTTSKYRLLRVACD